MRRILHALPIACLSIFCFAIQAQPPPKTETLAADSPRTTASGNRFTAPAGWTLETRGDAVWLTPPEGDGRIALVDVDAADADAAVRAAWKASGREAKWALKVANDLPPRDGWEQSRRYTYETSPNEQRFVGAQAARAGGRWTAVVIDLPQAVLDRRYAQFLLISDTLMPKDGGRESFAGRQAHALDAKRVGALVDFIRQAQRELGVPGVSVGLVQGGKVLLAEGYGVRALGKPEKVDGDSLYMVASNTKAMTTLMLARLVDRKRLAWDTPVTQLLPGFALGDAATTRKVQVRHLVCACTGLPRQDYEWLTEFGRATPETALATLATMQPTTEFGALYQYSNPLASAGGYVGAHVLHPDLPLGEAYDRAMQEEVFGPLRMRRTTFDFATAQRGNHAAAHADDIDGRPAPANMAMNHSILPVRPAGGAWSNVDDMLRYVQFELDGGVLPDGTRHVSEAALLERRKPMVALGNDVTYGMGLMVDDTWGAPMVFHGGSMIGYQTGMGWLPGHDVGLVLLTNSEEGRRMMRPVMRRFMELLFDGKPEARPILASSVAALRAAQAAERRRLTLPGEAAEAAKLAGAYRNPALGPLTVVRDGPRTLFDFGEWKSEAASRRNDDGSLSWMLVSPGAIGWELVVADAGGRRRLVMRTPQQEYVFDEAPAAMQGAGSP